MENCLIYYIGIIFYYIVFILLCSRNIAKMLIDIALKLDGWYIEIILVRSGQDYKRYFNTK